MNESKTERHLNETKYRKRHPKSKEKKTPKKPKVKALDTQTNQSKNIRHTNKPK